MREHRQAALLRPRVGAEQRDGGAVRQRGRVRRGHRVAEHRLELRELVGARVRAQVLVALEAEIRRHEIVEEAALVGGGQRLVRGDRQLVLILARDAHALGRDRLVLAHRHAGARLGVARDVGHEVVRTQMAEQLHAARRSLPPVGLEQHLSQVLVDADRGVAGGVDAAGDAPLDLAHGDLAADRQRRLQAGVARLLQVIGGGGVVERRAEHALAREVEVARMLQHRTGDDLAGALALQAEAGDQPVEGGGEHVLVGRMRVGPVGTGKGDPIAPEDRDLLCHWL